MTDLPSLADRVEQAEGPSRELDAEIAIHTFGWKIWRSKHGYWNFDGPVDEHVSTFDDPHQLRFDPDTGEKNPHFDTPPIAYLADKASLPEWTSSIGAALTLTDWLLITLSDNAGDGKPSAKFADGNGREAWGCARTKALAVVAAALRAIDML
jgi:hypothetical protein